LSDFISKTTPRPELICQQTLIHNAIKFVQQEVEQLTLYKTGTIETIPYFHILKKVRLSAWGGILLQILPPSTSLWIIKILS
jgi:hypothetical protein